MHEKECESQTENGRVIGVAEVFGFLYVRNKQSSTQSHYKSNYFRALLLYTKRVERGKK